MSCLNLNDIIIIPDSVSLDEKILTHTGFEDDLKNVLYTCNQGNNPQITIGYRNVSKYCTFGEIKRGVVSEYPILSQQFSVTLWYLLQVHFADRRKLVLDDINIFAVDRNRVVSFFCLGRRTLTHKSIRTERWSLSQLSHESELVPARKEFYVTSIGGITR